MNCRDAEKYMMNYMDGDLTEYEAVKLNSHIENCTMCAAAFNIYDNMLEEFDAFELIKAPEGFEATVMTKIIELENHTFEVQYSIRSKVWGHVWGTFTVLFGTGAIVAFYRQPILASLSQNPYIGKYVTGLMPVEQEITYQMQVVTEMVNNSFVTVNQVLNNSAGIILAILSVVCFLQYSMIRRRRKKSLVEHK